MRKYKIENKRLRYLLIKIKNNQIKKQENLTNNNYQNVNINNTGRKSVLISRNNKNSIGLTLRKIFKEDNLNNNK